MPHPALASRARAVGPSLALLLAIAACTASSDDGAAKAPGTPRDSAVIAPGAGDTRRGASADSTTALVAPDTSHAALLARADSAVSMIARRDWGALAALVHPGRGLRVTPYGYVPPDGECQVTLSATAVAALATDDTTRCWGEFDGSGEPMRLTVDAYYERFVYDKPYRDARRGAPNERLGHGNTLHNALEALGPGATFVEYHVPGTEQYSGMDWGSLRLVFAPHDGAWRLVGLVHDQWTI